MKVILPLLLLCLTIGAAATESSWTTLIKLGDKLRLAPDETAFVVSVSEPIYLSIEQPQKSSRGFRLRPRSDRRHLFSRSSSSDYVHRRTQFVDWRNPFPVAGPCTIRLGTSAIVTVRIVSTK
ncbi:hypothetical protein [Haloferula sp.]|uniref:hypothetical protein n=1 Tax=Haloferula sp. TaxID=2497595 RepID=UPI00329CF6A9